MSSHVLGVLGAGPETPIIEVATALADLMQAEPFLLRQDAGEPSAHRVDVVLDALAESSAVAAVLAAEQDETALCWQVVRRAGKPVALVPPGARRPPGAISRVLVPLDGTTESAAAVADLVELLAGVGVDIVVLHVFDAATVPMFWDQAAHTGQAWSTQFLERHAPAGARLELRTGTAGEHVVSVADAEQADLIALAWSRHLGPGRALTVRHCVLEAGRPVLLVPVDG